MKLDDDNSLVSRLWQKTIDESSAGINTDTVPAVPSTPWVEMMTPAGEKGATRAIDSKIQRRTVEECAIKVRRIDLD